MNTNFKLIAAAVVTGILFQAPSQAAVFQDPVSDEMLSLTYGMANDRLSEADLARSADQFQYHRSSNLIRVEMDNWFADLNIQLIQNLYRTNF